LCLQQEAAHTYGLRYFWYIKISARWKRYSGIIGNNRKIKSQHGTRRRVKTGEGIWGLTMHSHKPAAPVPYHLTPVFI
jgi:hypothetical protein